jgi:DNA-directed RNA polymerase subunit RPC12/RpoP
MTPFACPRCGKPLGIPDRREVGQPFQCPHCRQRFVLERPSETKSESSSPPEKPKPFAALPPGWVPLEPPKEKVEAQELPSFALSEPARGATLNGLAARRLAAKHRRRELVRLIIPGGVAAGIALVAIVFVWDHFANRGSRPAARESRVSHESEGARTQPDVGRQHQDSSTADHGPRPIRLLLAPAGVRMIVHLRPADLWGNTARSASRSHDAATAASLRTGAEPTESKIGISRGEELRRCLGPLSAWTERQIVDWCLYPPSQIDEILFSFVLRSPGDPPDVAATVWLKEATTVSEIAKRFGGQRREQGTLAICIKGERALVIRDGRTFAVGTQAAAQEMSDANEQPNPTDESIEELLKQTDRGREITFVSTVFASPSFRRRSKTWRTAWPGGSILTRQKEPSSAFTWPIRFASA